MIVSWSKRASKAAQQTARYIFKEFGSKASLKFLSEISHVSHLLEDNPYLGQIEPLLLNKKKQYRSIVINHRNKIVYYIKDETIRVSALWDTRREPKALGNELK